MVLFLLDIYGAAIPYKHEEVALWSVACLSMFRPTLSVRSMTG
jgi:hypothetical protein